MTLKPDEMHDDETGTFQHSKPDHPGQQDDDLSGEVTELRPSPAAQPRERSEEAPGSEVTVGDTLLTPDPGATVDSARESFDAETVVTPESDDGDLDATIVPSADASMTIISALGASLEDDVEPGHTIKAPASAATRRGSAIQPTITLKRRNVSQQESGDSTSDATVNVDADYQIEELLGEGGMGAVYAARQKSMDRPVAIKVLKSRAARLASSQDAFVSEAIITGRLDHPNIVPIYDVGKQPNDALFYAMKQVEGVEWKERFAENSVDENLDILLRVSDAIAFAHARGIIHRDLKPANIMLGPFGEVLVMDWGLAMPTEDNPSRESFPDARAGGTPHYMAPEMADGTERVDRRSDVYLLGAILFEIVTGKPPHALDIPKGNRRKRVLAVLDAVANNVIVETDASGELLDIARKAIATEPAERYQTVPEFQAALREYLSHEESIELAARAYERLDASQQTGEYAEFSRARFGFETALEEWPENDRATAGLLQTRFDYAKTAFDRGDLDLALSLIDESDSKQKELGVSIQQAIVERDARQQQLRRLRRISLAASLAVAIVAIGAAIWINSERDKALVAQQEEAAQREIAQSNEKEAQQQRMIAVSERQKAIASEKVALENEKKATIAEAAAVREAENALRSLKVAERNAYYSDMLLAKTKWDNASMNELNDLLDRYADRDDLRGFEWGYWNRLRDSATLTLQGQGPVSRVVFSPDGSRLATSSEYGGVKLWDASTGRPLHRFQGQSGKVNSVTFSPDGKRLASAGQDGTAIVWDIATRQQTLNLKAHPSSLNSVAFSADGSQLASASAGGTVKTWDVASGQEKLKLRNGQVKRRNGQGAVHSVSFSPDGKLVASCGKNWWVNVWDAASGERIMPLRGHEMGVNGVSFSPDMKQLASAGVDGKVRLWDVATWDLIHTLTANVQPVLDVSFSPDGKRLASAGEDGTVRVWDATTGLEVMVFNGHLQAVTSVSFSPDGTRLASSSRDSTVLVWDLTFDQSVLAFAKSSERMPAVSFSPDGTRLASARPDKTVRLWDVASGQQLNTLKGHSANVKSVSFSPDGTRLASASGDFFYSKGRPVPGEFEVKVWDVVTGQELMTLNGDVDAILGVVFSPDGTLLATGSIDGTVQVWNANNGQEVNTWKGHSSQVSGVAFSPDGASLASAGIDGTTKLWAAATGTELMALTTKGNPVNSVSFSPDGERLATAHHFGGIRVWDLAKADEPLTVIPDLGRITSVSFSPDGRRVVSGGFEGTVKVWDATTGQQTLTLPEQNAATINNMSFSPDGMRLVSADRLGNLKLWDARPWTPKQREQAKARSYLTIMRDRLQSLEELQTYIRDDKTISEEVRQQCLDWAELFWKNR